MAEGNPQDAPALVAARRRWPLALAAVIGLVALAFLATWLARKPIAADLIDRELAKRGVPARYEVKRIGLRTQRLEGVSIGDPQAPDLTADWVEVDLRATLGAPELRAIRAGGVRLRGRLVDGRLRLGAVDRLLPAPTGKPFRLPDLPVELRDARLALATPAGALTVRIDGDGNLANGFVGRYRATAPMLAFSGCRLAETRLLGAVTSRAGRPRFAGPFTSEGLGCDDVRLADLSGMLDATLEPGLDGWRGGATLASRAAEVSGWSAAGTRGQIDFTGAAARTAGDARFAAFDLAGAAARAKRAELGGRYVIENGRVERLDTTSASATSLRFEGGLSAERVALASAPRLDGVARSVAGTPLEPLAKAVARVAGAIGRSSDLRATLSLAVRGGEGSLRVASGALTGGGARLSFSGGEGMRLAWPGSGQAQIDGRLAMSGDGVPLISADLRQAAPGAPISGIARMQPFVVDGSRVALAPVRFEADRFSTMIEASGPLLGGRVEGAMLPLEGRIGPAGLVLNPRCSPLTFQRLSVSGLELEPARLRLCPVGAALVANGRIAGAIEGPRLRGTLGSSPITLAARRASFEGSRFRVAQLEARLGGLERVSRLDIAELSGAPGQGVSGRFAGGSGQIGRVPLIASDAAGRWRFSGGLLTVSGGLTLSDEPRPARFQPLVSRDFTLRIRGRDLAASGTLLEPRTSLQVANVALRHDLGLGTGSADIGAAIRFTPDGLQPEQVTRLTLGVVADLDGRLDGRGRIEWNGEGVTSTGKFRIEAASLSAPFGPVTGLAGDIRFTDLLGLETAPAQILTVATLNPGILVEDGLVAYRILPGFKVAVESGRWPFAGGDLTLRPTVLDFSEDAARNLIFDIRGLDAARFVNKLEFSNINATGVFDGALPMVFDADGGRIVGGMLASRAPGGTLSYIGEISNANLGIWGGIAFDALKSIAYENMTIGLDGRIDGEMVSRIRFAGVSRGTIQPVATGLIARIGGQLASKLQQIPFIFNIQIRAPFRGLIAMTRSFSDPSLLIEDRLGPGFEAVQPPASETKP